MCAINGGEHGYEGHSLNHCRFPGGCDGRSNHVLRHPSWVPIECAGQSPEFVTIVIRAVPCHREDRVTFVRIKYLAGLSEVPPDRHMGVSEIVSYANR